MDDQEQLQALYDLIDGSDGERLAQFIPEGALQLPLEQIQTVSFAFWIAYMAEKDLNDVIEEAWGFAVQHADEATVKATKDLLQQGIRGDKEIDPENMDYFVDKIKVYESFYGKDNRTKLFYKLNDIRNDLAHNRIEDLAYNDQPLSAIETKRTLLKDYFAVVTEEKDWTQSDFYKTLTPEEREAVEAGFEQLRQYYDTQTDTGKTE